MIWKGVLWGLIFDIMMFDFFYFVFFYNIWYVWFLLYNEDDSLDIFGGDM